jgi:DNA mismatch repair protein MutS
MMQQYFQVKNQYGKHIVFFRLGDFYEMFFDDAILVSKELELTLTGRDCGLGERAPMCGIPFHSAENYIKRLIDKGYKVAICEQTCDPSECKGIVPREVIRVVTPGTLIETNMLDETANNFICALYFNVKECAACFADVSTGEVNLFEYSGKEIENRLINELSRYNPVEILFNQEFLTYKNLQSFIKERMKTSVQLLDDADFSGEKREAFLKQFCVSSAEELGINEKQIGFFCLCGLFGYVFDTQKALIGRFSEIKIHKNETVMKLGFTARRNLELTETMRNKERKGTLIWVLDNTKTSMGKRLLRTWIEQPLIVPAGIIDRHEAVEQLVKKPVELSELSSCLSGVYDLERLMTRVMYKTATPRDLKALSATALKLPEINRILDGFSSKLITGCNSGIDSLEAVSNLIENSVVDEPPVSFKDGGIIKDGFNEELDGLRHIISGGKDIIDKIEEREKERTGIKNLKIGYNRVFGYYIEITKSKYELIPDGYIRKQTLSNCERFITEELKNAEATILGASEKINSLEADIFIEIREFIASQLDVVSKTAACVAVIDVLCSFAQAAVKNNYSKPEIAIDGVIDIKSGRHPVVELMQKDEIFVPNDTYLDLTDNKTLIITGPNMSGKSTYMRQVALITLMAQIGSFVPCDYARISICDQIFTRVGASDDLTAGQSTFMVEMTEVADIVKNATKHSLVILDEVGRGTSTFDGLSIAKAVVEYISASKNLGCKTLFATHYHELIELENELSGVQNFSVAVKRRGDDIKFLRKIVRGGADESYGIEVAKLAGLPQKIISRARELLTSLERGKGTVIQPESQEKQVSFGAINEQYISNRLRKLHLDEMSDEDLRYFVKELLKDL